MPKPITCRGCADYRAECRSINAYSLTLADVPAINKTLRERGKVLRADYKTHLGTHTKAELIELLTR